MFFVEDSEMPDNRLQNITILLVGVKHPGNIGSAARAMHNMGLEHLGLAAPQCRIDEESYRLACGGAHILERAKVHDSLAEALREVHLVAGATGKTGGYRAMTFNPRAVAARLLAQAEQQKVAVLFGPEDTGLTDEHLLPCQMLIRIPTAPEAHSINLAQAVMIVAYEIFVAHLERAPVTTLKLADGQQIEGMYAQMEAALLDIGFLQPQNARHMMFSLRRLFGRAGLQASDVRVLRGMARQMSWIAHKKY
jgi:tRNA/rRNA methyltransferase